MPTLRPQPVQLPYRTMAILPEILRALAKDIERIKRERKA